MNTATKTLEGTSGVVGSAAPAEPAAAEAWSMSVYTTLSGLLGQAKVDGIAMRFQSDLQTRFADLEDREMLRRDAHTVTSTAGMLGFASLSAAARTLETACARGDDFAASLSNLLRCRRVAGQSLAQHFQSH